jgi:hypothetical protein
MFFYKKKPNNLGYSSDQLNNLVLYNYSKHTKIKKMIMIT